MPTELERKARAILRDVYAKRGDWAVGNAARNGALSVHDDETVVAAIAAALQAQQPGAQDKQEWRAALLARLRDRIGGGK